MGLKYLGSSGISRIILKTIEKITCVNSTNIECVSKSNLELSLKEGLFKKEKAIVVGNGSSGGVDLIRFNINNRVKWGSEIRAKIGLDKQDFVFGFIGRITRDKGIDELLAAFKKLNNDCKLLLVGQQENVKELNQEIWSAACKNKNIYILNAVEDVEKYFAAIDVLVLPSYREGFGNVIIEAAAIGTPAIVSNIPGPVDAVDDKETGLIFEVKNIVDLQEKMRQIISMDYKLMGETAQKKVASKFSSELVCKSVYERKQSLLKYI